MKPPRLELSPELRWVMSRAFAPLELGSATGALASPERALELAVALDLVGRIATRQPHDRLLTELGVEPARKLQMLRLRVVALNQILARTTELVLHTAAPLGARVVLLKHAALRALGVVEPGARDARDVDVLVDGSLAGALHDALCEQGFRIASAQHPEQHLPTLLREPGEVVELHHTLAGLAVPGGNGASAASLLVAQGYTTPSPGSRAHVPVPALLAAHALVHGLVQHRTATDLYPALRTICDLCDLNFANVDDVACRAFVSSELSGAAIDAVHTVVAALSAGADPRDMGESSPGFELFAHLVAGAVDPDYQQALFLEGRHLASAVRARLTSFRPTATSERPGAPAAAHGAEVRRVATRVARSCAGYARLKLRRGQRFRV